MAADINATRRQRAWDAVTDRAFPRSWQRRVRGADYSLEITMPQLRSLHGSMVVSVDVLVTRDGEPIYDDRINSPNPPMGVRSDDGTVTESPLQAFRDHILQAVRSATKDLTDPHLMRDEKGRLKGDTLAVRSTTADGRVQSTSTGGTWSAARGGATLAARSATNPETIVASVSGSDYIAGQFFMDFDTSSLGSGATLSNGVFTIYGSGTAETNTNSYDIQIRPYNFGGSVTTADWVDCNPTTGWTNPTLMAHLALGSWNQTSGTANNFTVDSYADVSKTGSTYVVMGLSGLGSTTSPTGANSLAFRTADQSGTTSDPLLTVTYTPGVSGTAAAALQKALFSGSGAQAQTATIAAALQAAQAAFAGAQVFTGPVVATLQPATFSASGEQGAGVTGSAALSLQPATASMTGAMNPSGDLAASTLPPLFTGAGLMHPRGDMAVTIQPAIISASGATGGIAAIAAILSPATFAAAGVHVFTGSMAAELQRALFAGAGAQAQAGSIVAVLVSPMATFNGLWTPPRIIWAVAFDAAAIYASARDAASIAAAALDAVSITSLAFDKASIASTAYDAVSITREARDG